MKFRNFILLLPVLFFCCKKKDSNPANQSASFSFTTEYDSVITTKPNSAVTFSFNIKVLKGSIDTNPITYSITGLPANVTAIPATQTINHALTGLFTITTGDVPPGIDTLDFVISSTAGGLHKHKLILKIDPPVDYAAKLAGNYVNSYDYCQPAGILSHYTSTVQTVTDTPYQMNISNLKNLGAGVIVRALVTNVITIPEQTISGYTIRGTGTYSKDGRPGYDTTLQITIYDTLVSGSGVETCIVHLLK